MDANAWDERYAASELVWSSTPNQFVEAEVGPLPPGRALDLAAGEGRNAIWLAGRDWDVTAVDFSRAGLDKGRVLADRAGVTVQWVHGDALAYSPGPVFDLVVVAYLQLPATERQVAMRQAFAALKVGGTLLVVAHDSTNLAEGTGGPQEPAVLYTAEEVLSDLDGERFEVGRAERVSRVVPPDDEHGGQPVPDRLRRTGPAGEDCLNPLQAWTNCPSGPIGSSAMRHEGRTVQEAYNDAWQVRERTGQTDDSLLLQALRVRRAPAAYLDPGPAHDTLFGFWHDGVPPRRLNLSSVRGLASTLASAVRALRHAERDDVSWMDLPAGHRLSDVVRRHLHRAVDLTPLPFRHLEQGRPALARGARLPSGRRPPWSDVRVWLRTAPTSWPTGSAVVMAGAVPVGETGLPAQVETALRAEAGRGVFADGWLEVTAGSGDDVTVGTLRCHLPRV